jgi:serine/threonine-protein kinase
MAGDPISAVRPRIVGRYEILGKLAAGGMGSVHLGRLKSDAGLVRAVAIKRLHPELAEGDQSRLVLDEARLSMRVRHPNVVSTLDVVLDGEELLLVLDYVVGETLARLCQRGQRVRERIPIPIASAIIHGVLLGLHAAHEARDAEGNPLGLVHRDVSPQNVIVGADGVARVLDFGIAKALGRAQTTTHEGRIKGKLGYVAPEQIDGAIVDRRADLFSAAVVLWETLALDRLFARATAAEVWSATAAAEIPSIRFIREDVSEALEQTLLKGLARRPDDRFQTGEEFAAALERTAPPATSREVAEWLRETAGELLDARAAALAEVERGESVPAGADERSTRVESHTPSEARELTIDQKTPVAVSAATGGATRSRFVAVSVALAAVVAFVSFAVMRQVRRVDSADVAAATLPSAVVDAAPPVESTLPAPTAAGAEPISSASAAPSNAPRHPSTRPAVRKGIRPDCRSPFTIDSRGIRVPRPECF